MRRFIRSFLVRRKAQVTVVQDSRERQFETWVWLARDRDCRQVATYRYEAGNGNAVRPIAISEARRMADDLKRRQDVRVVEVLT